MSDQEHIERMAADYPSAAPAVAFVKEFKPAAGVDYTWTVEYAKKRYELFLKIFDDLDAKATTLIAAIGSGTTLFTAITIIAATTRTTPLLVPLSAIPSIASAFCAFLCAMRCRALHPLLVPPATPDVIEHMEPNPVKGHEQAFLIPQWHLCTALLRPIVDQKGNYVERATWFFAWTIALLALPFIVAIIERCFPAPAAA